METIIEFLSFTDPNVRIVTLGTMLLAASSAIVGCFTFLRKRALVGDAIAHAVLPGVCLAFIVGDTKNPLLLLAGAFITGWLSLIAIDLITSRSKIKEDAAIGIVLSVFFGVGILLLTSIQHSGDASQSGLDSFLFGKAAAIGQSDLYAFGSVALLLLICVILFFKEFTLLCFDEQYAKVIGFPVRLLELLLTTLTVLAVVIGIQAVGVVLMAALLITPAATARYWTASIVKMILLAAAFGALSGFGGAFISFAAPAMPTGPWIVMVLSTLAFLSFMLAPEKGYLFRLYKSRQTRIRILQENVLKTLYHLGEPTDEYSSSHTLQDIVQRRQQHAGELSSGLKGLKQQGLIQQSQGAYALTPLGLLRAKRIVKLHRLWEMYLTEFLKLAPDHVHDDADTIEHLITPELELKLEEQLKYPSRDPHDRNIPYA